MKRQTRLCEEWLTEGTLGNIGTRDSPLGPSSRDSTPFYLLELTSGLSPMISVSHCKPESGKKLLGMGLATQVQWLLSDAAGHLQLQLCAQADRRWARAPWPAVPGVLGGMTQG